MCSCTVVRQSRGGSAYTESVPRDAPERLPRGRVIPERGPVDRGVSNPCGKVIRHAIRRVSSPYRRRGVDQRRVHRVA